MSTVQETRIGALEQEVRDLILDAALLRDDLKRQVHGAYPEPDHRDSQGGRPSWVVARDKAELVQTDG